MASVKKRHRIINEPLWTGSNEIALLHIPT
jgi:hypothetical protein